MNNKGFTLIEILVTLLLLSVIVVISFVSISKVIEKSKQNDCKTLVNNIKMAVAEYVSDHRYDSTFTNTSFMINGGVLVNNNYLTAPIYNPFSKEEINPSNILINVELNADYTFKSANISTPAALRHCTS